MTPSRRQFRPFVLNPAEFVLPQFVPPRAKLPPAPRLPSAPAPLSGATRLPGEHIQHDERPRASSWRHHVWFKIRTAGFRTAAAGRAVAPFAMELAGRAAGTIRRGLAVQPLALAPLTQPLALAHYPSLSPVHLPLAPWPLAPSSSPSPPAPSPSLPSPIDSDEGDSLFALDRIDLGEGRSFSHDDKVR